MIRRRRNDDGDPIDIEAQSAGGSLRHDSSSSALNTIVDKQRRWRRWLRTRIRLFAIAFLALVLLVLVIHELYYFVVLNRIAIRPHSRNVRFVPLNRAKVAVVSLHRGLKFSGYLGKWLSHNKAAYAKHHGYAYADETLFPSEDVLLPLNEWQHVYKRRIKFDKLRFLLFLMETHPNLQYMLWLDADAVVTDPEIRIQDRVTLFDQLFNEHQSYKDADFCFVWAADDRPNTGVLLLVNTPVTRSLLKQSLATFSEKQIFIDQASFTAAVQANETYAACQLLLRNERSTLLQSRVRGTPVRLWKLGHWIMHLPNHNRWEMLQALSSWLPHYGQEEVIPCQMLSPIDPPDLSSLSEERRLRYEAVREAIRHAWGGYASAVLRGQARPPTGTIPHDDLSPLSRTGHSWLYYSATLHDSIDTLYLANLTAEYNEAVTLLTSYDIQTTSLRTTKTFEYSLRVLGGLLGAYSLSGDTRLLMAAKNAADAMIAGPFASSPTDLPRMYNVLAPPPTSSSWKASLHRLYARIYEWGRDAFTDEHHFNSLAGMGSFGVEFSFLTRVTRDWTYRDAANAIFEGVTDSHNDTAFRRRLEQGIVPTSWNVMTGSPRNGGGGLGSGADSFYEYLLKVPLLNGCGKLHAAPGQCTDVDKEMLLLYRKFMKSSMRKSHVLPLNGPPYENVSSVYPVDNSMFHHLLCFVPGLLALGAIELNGDLNQDMNLARVLLMGCHDAYKRTPSGLAPEQARIRPQTHDKISVDADPAASFFAWDRSYLLRPEYVESLFVLYRLTRDEQYQTMGWKVLESLNKHCKVEGGYAGLQDVYDLGKGHVDDMPSYFIAETLKYLLLLFGPDDYVSPNDFVFTTEAHPMRRIHDDDIRICTGDSENSFPVAVPWILLAAVIGILMIICVIACGSVWLWSIWRIRVHNKRKDA